MKKILFLVIVLFISTEVYAKCAGFDSSKCPVNICSEGTFMGDDGKCYSCDTDESVGVGCIGYEKAFELCPNRYFTWACKTYSKLKCFDETLVEKIIERNNEDWDTEVHLHGKKPRRYWINYTTHRCKDPDIRY